MDSMRFKLLFLTSFSSKSCFLPQISCYFTLKSSGEPREGCPVFKVFCFEFGEFDASF